MKRKYNKEALEEAAKNSVSLSGMCRLLEIPPSGGNYTTVKNYIKKFEIDITHFRGQGWAKGMNRKPNNLIPLSEILVQGSTYQSNKLRKRLFKTGFKEKICECCQNKEWLGKPIALELHHENGDKHDNRIENLKILCPNCHAFTDNYRGKNIN